MQRDVDQKNRNVGRLIASLSGRSDELDEALAHEEDRKLLASRQANYLKLSAEFAPACLGPMGPAERRLWWSWPLTGGRGLPLRIIGLNTALLSAEREDRGMLALGKEPLNDLFRKASPRDGDLVIVLSHHPLHEGWLADERDAEAWLRRRAHVHLYGHLHSAESEGMRAGSGADFVRVAAGAAHNEERSPTGHGYNVAAVLRCPDGTLRLRIWPRRWSSKNKDFRRDEENVIRNKDYAEHVLSVPLP